jgi:hypothetical protein
MMTILEGCTDQSYIDTFLEFGASAGHERFTAPLAFYISSWSSSLSRRFAASSISTGT